MLALALLAGCGGDEPSTTPPLPTSPERLRLEEVATGLSSPMQVVAAPGEPGRLYVVEQAGVVRVLEEGAVASAPFLDIHEQVKSGGEQGLLALAFHPEFPDDPRFYVHYSNLDGDTRVDEMEAGVVRRRQGA